jgi:hypothetical protein
MIRYENSKIDNYIGREDHQFQEEGQQIEKIVSDLIIVRAQERSRVNNILGVPLPLRKVQWELSFLFS